MEILGTPGVNILIAASITETSMKLKKCLSYSLTGLDYCTDVIPGQCETVVYSSI